MADYAELEELRVKFADVLDQARSDPDGYGQKLNQDPKKAFKEAGFQGDALEEVTEEVQSNKEGKKPVAHRPCGWGTCWNSFCGQWDTFAT